MRTLFILFSLIISNVSFEQTSTAKAIPNLKVASSNINSLSLQTTKLKLICLTITHMSNYNSGTYLVIIELDKTKHYAKLIKQ